MADSALITKNLLLEVIVLHACAVVLHKQGLPLCRNTYMHKAMLEIILSVLLYFGAVALLIKGVFVYCEHCPE